jgi:hypothetical protein
MMVRVGAEGDEVSSERGRYPAHGSPEREKLLARLADRAKFIRLETVRLAEIPGAGHYTGTDHPYQLDAAGVESVARQLLAR